MKLLLIWPIKAYWYFIPPKKRDTCIFKQSCSHFVFDTAKKKGLLQGVKALRYRRQHCRAGYYIVAGEKGSFLISARNGVFYKNDIADHIFKEE